MLPKQNRLSRDEFDRVYNNGESVSGDIGHIKFLQTEKPAKVSCVVSTDAVNKSVTRTQIRRRAYAAIKQTIDDIPKKYSIIWFLPAEAKKRPLNELRTSFVNMLTESDIIVSGD